MSIMWMKDHAKWVVTLAAILVVVGLVLMDRAGASNSGFGMQGESMGSVNGEEIAIGTFQQEMQGYVRQEESRTGKAPEGQALAQMRSNLFNFKVQNILLQKIYQEYQIHPSGVEMQDYALAHPTEVGYTIARYEGPDRVPVFLRDSTLDTVRFRNWMAQDSVYERIGLRALEGQLKSTVIPQMQLQQILKSQIHHTELEEAFRIGLRENLSQIRFYGVAIDSFPLTKEKFGEAQLKSHFDANPDSFYSKQDAARLRYVRIPIAPSYNDSVLMRDFAKELKERAEKGEKFEDLAKSYSNDLGSIDSGGRLGGFQARSAWVPAFAEAAFGLNPGEISEPVLTPFGYHVILLHAKKKEKTDTVEKADISHILLKIAAGSETIDSITDAAQQLQIEADKQGLEAAAKSRNLPVLTTQIFEKGNSMPLLTSYVQGVQSFAFSAHEKKAKVSEVLQNEEGAYIFERDKQFPKGRNFERAKDEIANSLLQKERVELARKELETLQSQILAQGQSLAPRVGKAVLDSTILQGAESYVPMFGYGSPALLRSYQQKISEWGPVRITGHGAVVAILTQSKPMDAGIKSAQAKEALSRGDAHLVNPLFQEWLSNLPKTAKVENNVDMVYRN